MKMFNGEIQNFINFLMEEEVSSKKSRMRTRFIKLAQERLKEIEDTRIELLKKHGNVDDNGELKTVEDSNGQMVYDLKDREAFNVEYNEMMLEEFVVDETPERKDMLLALKDIVLDTERTFKGQEAIFYDRFADIVEEINYTE